MKTTNLKNAYAAIKRGEIIDVNGCRIWLDHNSWRNGVPVGRKRCICWRSYGQSANEMSISALRWIMRVIAKSETYEFTIATSIY